VRISLLFKGTPRAVPDRRTMEERLVREMGNKDSTTLLMVCLGLVLCLGVRVLCVRF
jgi:hypothetical protein